MTTTCGSARMRGNDLVELWFYRECTIRINTSIKFLTWIFASVDFFFKKNANVFAKNFSSQSLPICCYVVLILSLLYLYWYCNEKLNCYVLSIVVVLIVLLQAACAQLKLRLRTLPSLTSNSLRPDYVCVDLQQMDLTLLSQVDIPEEKFWLIVSWMNITVTAQMV